MNWRRKFVFKKSYKEKGGGRRVNYEEAVLTFGKIAKQLVVVAGMQAENSRFQILQSDSLPYGETQFFQVADEIDKIIGEI